MRKIRKPPSCDDEGSDEGDVAFKKGPWTTTEDAILVDYVKKHGEGNWNAVQKNSGLARCGKSCRLRWANHLRPDLKRGAFTPEEERRIIELHAKMGNKWARMAAELPGRTDNEIKNFWNTRIKRLQRTGMPIYPPEIFPEYLGKTGKFDLSDMHTAGSNHSDLQQESKFEIPLPVLDIEKLENNHSLPSLLSSLNKVPSLHRPREGNCTSDTFPLMQPLKRFKQTEIPFPFVNLREREWIPSIGQYVYPPEVIAEPVLVPSPPSSYGETMTASSSSQPLLGVVPGCHAIINGNFPSSESSFEAQKLELPSLQFVDTSVSCRSTPSPVNSIGHLHPSNQSPPTIRYQSDHPSPRGGTGLLEDIVYEAKYLRNRKKSSWPQITDVLTSTVPILNLNKGPNSPLGCDASLMFDECTPDPILTSAPNEHQSLETMFDGDIFDDFLERKDASDEKYNSRPDVVLDSSWFGQKFKIE